MIGQFSSIEEFENLIGNSKLQNQIPRFYPIKLKKKFHKFPQFLINLFEPNYL